MSAFQFSETSAFTPVNYDSAYDISAISSAISPAFAEVSSNLHNFETRQLQQSFVDQWIANLHQPSYENYNVMSYPYLHQIHECLGEPGFIRKRNERERMRVRNVNDGYARLRDHLPIEPTEKRLSKVETLRGAINYIKFLQSLLDNGTGENQKENEAKDTSDKVQENGEAITKEKKTDKVKESKTDVNNNKTVQKANSEPTIAV